MTLPVMDETASVISQLRSAQFPPNSFYNGSDWNSTVTPAVFQPLLLPPPIVIAPRDVGLESDRGIPVRDPANEHVQAPAVAVTTRVPRPITGRGCRDQLPLTAAAPAADATVYLSLFFYISTYITS